jgi:signal transduction histidine kinase
MLLSVTAGVHFGGGVNNVSNIQLYAALIGLAGLLLAEHAALAMSAAAAVAYATLVWAESRGLLWTLLPGMRPVDRQIATVIMVALCLVMFAGLVFYAVRQIRVVYGRVEELRREAVRALSHDLKNPLMVIRGYAYLMSDADPAERAEYLMRIQHAAQQALDMVHNVLDASNLEERMFVPSRSRADLNGLVAEAVEAYRPAAQARGVRLSVSLGKDIPDMEIDVHLVGRAVANLVSNGIKYSDRGGVVTVATYREGDRVAIEARDTGHGIPQEEQDGIFRQYSRILSATHSVEGTGLGLHIVRCVAEAHGGSVAVDSTPGLGSTFTLWLPLLPV